jgi:molybdopterin/thiamine biosynthesis adenylyltransferase
MQPDYSRQQLLKEIGAQGQALLARSRVLVVGAGGLGSPVLQYLAGAGVGCLGVVDADTLDASNLHRQPIYALADVGSSKVALARAAVARINPAVQVESHALRLDADNALDLIRRYDVVVDCSDNFRTKYLINDAAVLAHRPAIFASVYQYEGQLQVYQPQATHACLRCLWPDAVADGVVGNCAEAGVLGPVPGVFGTLQALLAIKVLLGMSGQLEGELLLLDFMNFGSTKLKAPRRADCHAPDCALIRRITPEEAGIFAGKLRDIRARYGPRAMKSSISAAPRNHGAARPQPGQESPCPPSSRSHGCFAGAGIPFAVRRANAAWRGPRIGAQRTVRSLLARRLQKAGTVDSCASTLNARRRYHHFYGIAPRRSEEGALNIGQGFPTTRSIRAWRPPLTE